MTRKEIEIRLGELGLYSEYYLRRELKLLPQILEPSEALNCVLTGIHEGCRKMLAVTDRRLLLLSSQPLAKAEVQVIPKESVTDWEFKKKFLRSSVAVTAGDTSVKLTGTQMAVYDCFVWAMEQLQADPGTQQPT